MATRALPVPTQAATERAAVILWVGSGCRTHPKMTFRKGAKIGPFKNPNACLL